jgi:xanthine/CO dehydrogenase XdhC/CoxF family maturation factor
MVLATLVSATGSSYRRPGARLLITGKGERLGSISGGCLEEDVLAQAHKVLATGLPQTVTYDTTSENDLVWGVGLGCHGVVRVFIERLPVQPAWAQALAEGFLARRPTDLAVVHGPAGREGLGTRLASEWQTNGATAAGIFLETIEPPPALLIFGAGDDAQPLARFAHELGWRITVADPRPAFANSARFPHAAAVIVAPAMDLGQQVRIDPRTAAVVMTHHYVHDVPILRALLPQPLAYLGLLGPKQRAEKILGDLGRDGLTITAAMRERLHAPVGLDLGATAPESVALSIVAEIQASLTRRSAGHLRERTRPIHG